MSGTRWRIAGLFVLLAALLAVAACGGGDEAAEEPAATEVIAGETTADATEPPSTVEATGVPEQVGIALTGPRNGKGYNQSYYDGMVAAGEEYGFEVAAQDNANSPQLHLDSLRNLAEDNSVVMGVGAEFAEPALTLAPQYPDVTFVIVNGEMSPDVPNVYAYFVRQGVPAYPAGAVAGTLTQTKKIGFIGGTEIPPTFSSEAAFEAGAQSVDPVIEQVSVIVGDFYDAAKAKEAARAQIAAGADVIYAFQDGAAVTAVGEAITESGKDVKMFTPIFPRCDEFPGIVVGTAILSLAAQVSSIMGDVVNGTLPTEPKFYGIEDLDIQRFELCPDFATPELTELVDEIQAGINSGEITLPEGV
jgi:basic membrane lipoprotein Med (substrate-binding protein (PBP1-ABC) superfamily)